ncbi:MAG: thioredoxin-like protein [Candidatus Peregrinibacteria bacterium GW2011_GWE2_39_6]|nr:MAG: thioredoxin-like protein [Candidatus Peregrinibacteria bacterium GW2011_GWF2_39_17]KKR25179.1 MAG: thioredoxin-like protein [Candidatus Peregrinibacteria bacterium GW2011_GWE2_39_6]HCW32211.1 thioredoxin family protein [Candidatus Peregrinibacteria bacterium]
MAEYTLPANPFPLSSKAPIFTLPGVDGQNHSLKEYKDKPFLVIIFMCNHCPYVQAYLDRLIALQNQFTKKGVQFLGINSNDETTYPDDSFENMVKMANSINLNFPYLRDETQKIAKNYHAERTPQVFVFNQKRQLVYEGGIDNSYSEPENTTETPLKDALMALTQGQKILKPEANFIGCSIKWKA